MWHIVGDKWCYHCGHRGATDGFPSAPKKPAAAKMPNQTRGGWTTLHRRTPLTRPFESSSPLPCLVCIPRELIGPIKPLLSLLSLLGKGHSYQ